MIMTTKCLYGEHKFHCKEIASSFLSQVSDPDQLQLSLLLLHPLYAWGLECGRNLFNTKMLSRIVQALIPHSKNALSNIRRKQDCSLKWRREIKQKMTAAFIF